MKYRLKKDLPFAKAGTEVDFNKIDNIIYSKTTNDLCSGNREYIDDWIEEVKPREFMINIDNQTICNAYYAYPTERCKGLDLKGYIKVREVIE